MARNIVFTVQSSGLPTYLEGANALQWKQVAASPHRIIDKWQPEIRTMPPGYTGGPDSFSGAAVDHVRRELIISNGGGHDGYGGNETYVLKLGANAPQWKRMTDSSTPEVIQLHDQTTEYPPSAVLSDGFGKHTDEQPLSSHLANETQYCNGRVWFTGQSSAGYSPMQLPCTYSWNRDAAGEPSSPLNLASTPSSASLWEAHGWYTPGNINGTTGFSASAVDTQRNRVWGFNPTQNTIYSLNAASGLARMARLTLYPAQMGRSADTNWNSITEFGLSSIVWACCAPDLGILVMGCWERNRVAVWNVSGANPSSYLTTQVIPTTATNGGTVIYDETSLFGQQGATTFQLSYGAVYHAPSKSILLYEPKRKPSGEILQLRIPTTYGGNSTGWTITKRQTTDYAAFTSPVPDNAGYSRFNIINDIGNGEPVLVMCSGYERATHVCRIGSLS
jgi:hypothetical protein